MGANEAMLKVLMTLAMGESMSLSPRLQGLLGATLINEDECWFLEPLRDGARKAALSAFPDRTGFECFVNHIHVSDFVEDQSLNEIYLLVADLTSHRKSKLASYEEHAMATVPL